MQYRREIDGLRAIAILPVVAYHAGADVFSGGFLGVDVFFVISGFLITGLLLEDLDAGRHSIRAFYERRVRRILPALVCVLCLCIPFAWLWMLPKELEDFFASLFSVIVFLANFFFLSQLDYFSPSADLQPLVHTWSLSIEEQYYLLAPALLAFLWRRGRRLTLVTACLLTAASFMICLWATQENPARSFFFSGSRFWEIGIGSICAILAHGRPASPRPWISLAGLCAILASFVLLDSGWPLPGMATVLPVAGTAAVLMFADQSTPAGRFLGSRVLVAIGLVSYSAYLIHQPLFAFARIRSIVEPHPALMALLAVLTFFLAFLSWRFVEQPFRRKPSVIPARSVLWVGGLASLAVATVSLAGYGRLLPASPAATPEIMQLEQRLEVNFGLSRNCDSIETALAGCTTAAAPDTVVWGDSYAMHLVDGLQDLNLRLVQMTMSACTPVTGLAFTNEVYGPDWAASCIAFNRSVVDWIIATPEIRTVIMSSAFAILHKQAMTEDGQRLPDVVDIDMVADQLMRTASVLQDAGKKVILIAPTPTAEFDLGNCIVRSRLYGSDPDRCSFPLSEAINAELFPLMDRLSEAMPVVRLEGILCPSGVCRPYRNETVIYRDAGHLSHEGSSLIAPLLELRGGD